MVPVGPESHEVSPRDEREIDKLTGATTVEEEGAEGKKGPSFSGQQQEHQQRQQHLQQQQQQQQQQQRQQQQRQQQHRAKTPIDDSGIEEDLMDARDLASGALTAAIVPGRLLGSAGPGVLIAAGVALSGISFLSETEGDEGPLWNVSQTAEELPGNGDHVGAAVPRVLGMRGLVSHSGARQALVVVWVERPSFQVLDVGHAGSAEVVEEMSLERRHR